MPDSPETDSRDVRDPMKRKHKTRLVLLLLLSVFLHFYRLSPALDWYGLGHPDRPARPAIPRIYSDEALQARILQDFVAGHMRVESISWTGFSAFHPYPVLYYLVVAPFYAIFQSVLVSRFVTAAAAVLTTWLIFLAGRRIRDVRAGLWAAFFFTIMPFQTLFTRWGFTTAVAMPLVTAALYFAIDYRVAPRRRSAWLAGLFAGLATVTIYWAAPIIVVVAVMVLTANRRDGLLAAIVAVAVPLVMLLAMVGAHGFEAVRFDIATLTHTFGGEMGQERQSPAVKTFAGYGKLFGLFVPSLGNMKLQMVDFMSFGAYHLLGLLGLLVGLAGWRRWGLFLAFMLLSLPVVATRGVHLGMFYYPALVFLPVLMLGCGAFASAAFAGMERLCEREDRSSWFYMVLLTIPFLAFLVPGALLDRKLLSGRLDASGILGTQYCIWHTERLDEVADYVNERVKPADVVVTTPLVGHRIDCHVASLRQLIAWDGKASDQYPPGISKDRFAAPLDLDRIAYLVTDYYFLWHTLTLKGVAAKVIEMEAQGWHPVFERSPYVVYAPPDPVQSRPAIEEAALICGNPPLYFEQGEKEKLKQDYDRALFDFTQAAKAASRTIKSTTPDDKQLKRAGRTNRDAYYRKRATDCEKLATYYDAMAQIELDKRDNTQGAIDAFTKLADCYADIERIQIEHLSNTEAADRALTKMFEYCNGLLKVAIAREDWTGAIALLGRAASVLTKTIEWSGDKVRSVQYFQLAHCYQNIGSIQKFQLKDEEAAEETLKKIRAAVETAQKLQAREQMAGQ